MQLGFGKVFAVSLASLAIAARAAFAADAPPTPPALPSIDTLVSNVLDRIVWGQKQTFGSQYSFTRIKAVEELKEDGTLSDRDEKQYEIFPISGHPFVKWVAVNGKPLPRSDRLKEADRERTTRVQLAGVTTPAINKKPLPITPEILAKYELKVLGTELLNGRAMWVLSIKPKPGDLPINKIQDRLANKMAGKVWIDALEYEVAKADLHLTADVKLVGGIVAVVRKFDYLFERSRVDEGVWFTTRSEANIEGREVVLSKRLRYREESKDFKKVGAG